MKLSDHFDSKEFRCRCFACGEPLVDPRLIGRLEQLRAILNAEIPEPAKQHRITVTSGCRCPARNLNEGGKSNSRHLYDRSAGKAGQAADIYSPTVPVWDLYEAAQTAHLQGIGVALPVAAEPATGRTSRLGYLHVDVRDVHARWGYDDDNRVVALAEILKQRGVEV